MKYEGLICGYGIIRCIYRLDNLFERRIAKELMFKNKEELLAIAKAVLDTNALLIYSVSRIAKITVSKPTTFTPSENGCTS